MHKLFAFLVYLSLLQYSGLCPDARQKAGKASAGITHVTGISPYSFKTVTITSRQQRLVTPNQLEFIGDVVITADNKVRINAEKVFVDRTTNSIHVPPVEGSWIIIQTDDATMLARQLFINADSAEMKAHELKVHTAQGRISARSAECRTNGDWQMNDILFTACQEDYPHWSFAARRGCLHKKFLVRVSGISFMVGKVPIIFFPLVMFSLNSATSTSGFFFPKMYFDKNGFAGIKSEYYMDLGARCDNTVGLYYRHRLGIIASDELRWANSPEELFTINAKVSREWDSWIERDGKIVRGGDTNYLIKGKYLQPLNFGSVPVQSLVFLDLGSDKGIEYRFYNELNAVDNTFENFWILRHATNQYQLQGGCESERVRQSRFSQPLGPGTPLQEKINNLTVTRVAPLDYSSAYYPLNKWISYSQDCFVDYCDLRETEKLKMYDNQARLQEVRDLAHVNKGAMRFGYVGRAQCAYAIGSNHVVATLSPNLHLRSSLQSNNEPDPLALSSSSRPQQHAFVSGGVEWNFSELNWNRVFVQPQLSWSFVPQVKQDHWFWMDKYDRVYPSNVIAASTRCNYAGDDDSFSSLMVSQGVNCGSSVDLLPLVRNPYQRHMLPLTVRFEHSRDSLYLSCEQLLSWKHGTLLQLTTTVGLERESYNLSLSYLYQHPAFQRQCKLLSDVPHFLLCSITVPLGSKIQAQYESVFYADIKDKFFRLNRIRPLCQNVYLSYRSDCWAVLLGYEEKRYKRCGKWQSEQAFVFSFKLESLGSFAKKFKRPPMMNEEE